MPVEIAAPLEMTSGERAELETMAVSTSLPYRVVVQGSGLLLAAEGEPNAEIARACSTTTGTVRRWRAKPEAGRVAAVGKIGPGRGRKPSIPQSTIEAIVDDTLHTVPDDGSTAWSTRAMAERHGVGKDTVARIWRARKLRPWRVDTWAEVVEHMNDPGPG